MKRFRLAGAGIAMNVLCGAAAAAQDTAAVRLAPVVTVTREAARSTLDVPYAVSFIQPDSARPGQPHTFVEQTLALLPGVTVANRNNPSQDARVSIRGFGARSAFGLRSIRVLRDGMPLTLADGQTPIDYLDLESVGHIEAIRGAASSLYGNASGGVLDIRSAPPPAMPFAGEGRIWAGSDALLRSTLVLSARPSESTFAQGNIGRTTSDGYRAYAQQRLTNWFGRAGTTMRGTEIAVTALGLDMPVAQNPGALTRAQLDSAPSMADPLAVNRLARKEVSQWQTGISARRPFGAGAEAEATGFAGGRSLYNPLPFAVVGVERKLAGGSIRGSLPFERFGMLHRFGAGMDIQWMDDERSNWANCNGLTAPTANCPDLSQERGRQTIDQRELVSSIGAFVRQEVEIGAVRVSAGLRADAVEFELQDRQLDNGDDSGVRRMTALSPMAGLAVRLSPLHAVYANVSSAFETPTTTELGNQPDGSSGLNTELQPQLSTTYEIGVKGVAGRGVSYDAAVFTIEVRDELIPFEVPGGAGRTFFRNAGKTRRAGVELSLGTSVGPVALAGSYGLSRFRFRDFAVGAAEYAGNAIPGIPLHQAQASATWRRGGTFVVADGIAKSEVFANDANTASAPGFAVFNVRGGADVLGGRVAPVIGVQNVFDRRYVGSIAVNATGATLAATKFYEPAPGRTWFAGMRVRP